VIGTRHHELQAHIDPIAAMETVLSGFDEPFGNPTALLTNAICGLVRKYVTVVLSGDGGDECFGGYPRYQGVRLMQSWRMIPRWARRFGDGILRSVPEAHDGRYFARRLREFSSAGLLDEADVYPLWLSTFTPEQKAQVFSGDLRSALAGRDAWEPLRFWAAESGETDPAARAMYVDVHAFLPNNVLQYGDRMSMAHGLEVRVPFADRETVETMAAVSASRKLQGGVTKKILRDSMYGRLPKEVLKRRKSGFNPPMGVWLTGPLRGPVEELLSEASLLLRGWFDPVHVRAMWHDHESGRRDNTWHLWALVLLEAWARR
jgi:asparagine synthase (glutamine-hydrolysing)